jgi:uncharacterized membrane protein
VSRLRVGEWLAGLASAGLLALLFANWFSADLHPLGRLPSSTTTFDLHQTGWASLGWLLVALLVIVALGGLSIAYMTLRRTSPAWPVGAAVLTIALGAVTVLILLVRVLTQPGLGEDLSNGLVLVEAPAYLGLLCTALIPVGAWLALRDERVDAPESAYTPPPARPVPGT